MQDSAIDVQQQIAISETPGEEFQALPWTRQRVVFFQLPESIQRDLLYDMDRQEVRRFVRRLDPDDAADAIGLLDGDTQEAVLGQLDSDRRERIEFLLKFSPDSAAGMMDLGYVTVDKDRGFEEVARLVRRHEARTGRFPTVFVTDGDQVLGELPGHTLALVGHGSAVITEYLRPTPTVRYAQPESEVIEAFRANPQSKIVVLDEDDSILGVIYADDLLQAIEEAAGQTLYEFTGVDEQESVLDGSFEKIRRRYKWLIINLGTAFLAAATVGLFEDTIAALTLLAIYMPVVAGMGGNAGTQSMAVMVRGIALEQISLRSGGRAIGNEVLAGGANGVITGSIVAVIATLFNQSPMLGLVLGIAMVLNLVIAGFFGALVPLVLDRLGYDPATSATIFITTATDVLGFFIFLGLAQVVLL
ncbi:magnesium transporter [Haloferax sp. Atlit-47N]|uniref:Magnesium transporter n=1 Tax=Haloferax sp. Atlit-48N TaxID=2077198 RepID=A0ACD5I1M2_9EURY|nr:MULTISPECIES: magnesium transporter [unclassified Haloferax]RDZ30281.1 magnesium transporter [Haloferax sp. Atlit-48N]RDZ35609.1 magnesium transporter [Haloferax sp. Atlit-47N]